MYMVHDLIRERKRDVNEGLTPITICSYVQQMINKIKSKLNDSDNHQHDIIKVKVVSLNVLDLF